MKRIIFCIALLGSIATQAQNVFTTNSGTVSFFSEAPLENIDATSTKANCILNVSNGDVVSIIAIRSFKFEKALMEEHFNEKYLESDKFKDATFKGKITEPLSVDKDTTYKVNVKGTITIHGVEKPAEYTADYTVKNGMPSIQGSFNVALKDHDIAIPKLVIQNIAEVVRVTCKFELAPYQKKK
jgi:hypothetical protein